jgi:hypothetical protein
MSSMLAGRVSRASNQALPRGLDQPADTGSLGAHGDIRLGTAVPSFIGSIASEDAWRWQE